MKKNRLNSILCLVMLAFAMAFSNTSFAQRTIPFEIRNTSSFPDNDLFVAIVGIDYIAEPDRHVWINPRTSQVLPMDPSYNTIQGPTPNGNMGPGQNGMYANCFARLSEIPNKTFNLPGIAGCRVFISRGQQLYFYFFGSTGAPSGYTAPDHLNPNDPNKGIMFEIIELTNNQYGFFGNHSRVDAFKYPMGLELYGDNGYFQRVGELKSAAEIISLYKANVPTEFQGSVNSLGEIWAPSKTAAFQDGTNGSTPGPYANYLKPYIDQIWEKYKNQDLEFNAGQAGVFRGRVIGEELRMVEINGGFGGRTGVVRRRPTTQEALEGKGVLDDGANHPDDLTKTVSLVVQSQLTAAINRHMVDVTSANPGRQDWHNKANFYKANPMNHYAKFWHLPGISINELAYGFAYDDVADHSPSLHTPTPTRVIAVFGGYANSCSSIPAITPYLSVNGGSWQQTASATLNSGGRITMGPHPTSGGSWSWTGPNGFTSASREITISNIQTNQGGNYVATFTNTSGCSNSRTFSVTVNGCTQSAITPYLTVNGGAWQQTSTASLNAGGRITMGPHPTTGGTWRWSGPNGFTSTSREVSISNIQTNQGGNYIATFTNSSGCESSRTFGITVTGSFSQTIEAENYTLSSGIMTEDCQDNGLGKNVGSFDAGDWLVYDINLPTSGTYRVTYRVASIYSNRSLVLEKAGGSPQYGTITIPNTGSWQGWTSVSHLVTLPAGQQQIALATTTGGLNINRFHITNNTSARIAPEEISEITFEGLSLYPNPVKGKLNLTSSFDENSTVQVMDLTGNQLVKFNLAKGTKEIDLSKLAPGAYLIKINTKGISKIEKIYKE